MFRAKSSDYDCQGLVQAGFTIKPLGPCATARAHANSPRGVCCTYATRAAHRLSLSRSHGRSTYPSGTPAHTRRPADMPTKKVRKNRYMRRMQSRHGRLSWGMPFPARFRRSHHEHACRLQQSASTGARTVSSTRSAEKAALLEAGRCRPHLRCRLHREEGERGAW